MKIFSAAVLRQWDAATLEAQSITLDGLVGRVGARCAKWLDAEYPVPVDFLIICGTGLNGADGLRTASALRSLNRSAKAVILRHRPDFNPVTVRASLDAASVGDPDAVQILEPEAILGTLSPETIIVDAITGTGLNRPLDGWLATFVKRLNELPNEIVSLDLPSGLAADELPTPDDIIVNSKRTLTFQTWKRSLLHREGGKHAGAIHVLDIGLARDVLPTLPAVKYETVDQKLAAGIYQPRTPFSHKGSFGTVLIAGGRNGMAGAVVLAGTAAGRAGAGKVRIHTASSNYAVVQTAAPECMCSVSAGDVLSDFTGWEAAGAIGVGPGLGTAAETATALEALLKSCSIPLVLDADALNILSENPSWWGRVPSGTVITPHPKEFERLFGESADTMQAVEKARTVAMQRNIVVVLKDHRTAVCTPDGRCFYNTGGTPALATGGSGDVLTGIITALLAQKYAPEHAAVLGVWLHGRAGYFAAAKTGSDEAVIASDIAAAIGQAFAELRSPKDD